MKHRRFPRHAPSLAIAAALALFVAFGPSVRVDAQAPPPPPLPNATPAPPQSAPAGTPLPSSAPIPTSAPSAIASPSPSPAPRGRRRGSASPTPQKSGAPEPSATPTSPAFATLDGTWEVQLQFIDRTEYSYLVIHQIGSAQINGVWRVAGKEYPFDGSYDGRLVRLLVKEPAGNVTMSGYVEGASDMVGTIDLGKGNGTGVGADKADPTPFTAEHRGSSRGSIFKKGA